MNKLSSLTVAIVLASFTFGVTAGDATKGKAKTVACAGCHGADGNSQLADNPKLAGQSEKYLVKQLKDFKSGARKSVVMAPMAGMVADADLADVAAFYASQKVQHTAVDKKYIELGQKLFRGGDSDRDVPACIACHGAKGEGLAAAGFPAISGQTPEYSMVQLKAFRSGSRDNDENGVMRDVAAKMSDEQIEAIAHFLAGLH